MTDRTDNQGQNTGAGSRQQEQQTAGGGFRDERQSPGGSDPNQSGAGQREQGGSYRPQGDRGIQFEADQGQDIDFQTNQQGGAPEQQADRERLDELSARTAQPGEQSGYGSRGGIGSQQEQQSGTRQEGAGTAGPAAGDTRGGNQANR